MIIFGVCGKVGPGAVLKVRIACMYDLILIVLINFFSLSRTLPSVAK